MSSLSLSLFLARFNTEWAAACADGDWRWRDDLLAELAELRRSLSLSQRAYVTGRLRIDWLASPLRIAMLASAAARRAERRAERKAAYARYVQNTRLTTAAFLA